MQLSNVAGLLGRQILKNEKMPNKGQIFLKNCLNNKIQSWNFIIYCKFCSDFFKIKNKIIYYFLQHSKNGQIILFLAKIFKKRPNGNP